MRQRSSLLKAVIAAFPCVSLPFFAVPLLSQRSLVAIRRLARFRALGAVAGLCLLHHNVSLKLPLFFCRHVYKFLLGASVVW
eukprot:SAG22_NODE_11686_length_473_cov_2.085561_1_plen_82_part_00